MISYYSLILSFRRILFLTALVIFLLLVLYFEELNRIVGKISHEKHCVNSQNTVNLVPTLSWFISGYTATFIHSYRIVLFKVVIEIVNGITIVWKNEVNMWIFQKEALHWNPLSTPSLACLPHLKIKKWKLGQRRIECGLTCNH